MSFEWPLVTVEEIAAKQPNAMSTGPFGSAISSKYFTDSGVPVIRGSNLSTDISTRIIDKGIVFVSFEKAKEFSRSVAKVDDLVFTCWGTINQVGLIDASSEWKEYIISNKQMKLTVDKNIADPRYVYYVFSSPEKQLEIIANGIGAAVPGFNLGQLKKHSLKLPPLNIQRAIADHLELLDKKLTSNRQINQTLEQIAQALFKSWFVDFEPVKAKIAVLEAGGSQEEATLAAMTAISGKDTDSLAVFAHERPEQYAELKATAELFPSAMQDSELGETPVGWALKPFGHLLSHTIGGDWGKNIPDEKHKTQARIIRGTDIYNIKSCQDGNIPTRFVEEKKLKTRGLIEGDIIIEVSGGSPTQPTGRSLFITNKVLERLSLPVEPASFCRLFRPINKEIGLMLSLHLDKIYQDGKTWLYQNQSTGISNFQTKIFLDKEIVISPSKEIIEKFAKNIDPLFNLIYSSENIRLAHLRDTLLPKLLSGEITLPEAEQAVSEAENV